MNNPIDPVLNWYEMAHDSLRIAGRVANKQMVPAMPTKHVLRNLTSSEAAHRIAEAQRELKHMAVVAMVAVFERVLRDYLMDQVLPRLSNADQFDQGIRDQVHEDIEFWNISACLIDRLFKQRVDGKLCGLVKQVIDYRNRVAHGHVQGQPPPATLTPEQAYKRLRVFLHAGGVITP